MKTELAPWAHEDCAAFLRGAAEGSGIGAIVLTGLPHGVDSLEPFVCPHGTAYWVVEA